MPGDDRDDSPPHSDRDDVGDHVRSAMAYHRASTRQIGARASSVVSSASLLGGANWGPITMTTPPHERANVRTNRSRPVVSDAVQHVDLVGAADACDVHPRGAISTPIAGRSYRRACITSCHRGEISRGECGGSSRQDWSVRPPAAHATAPLGIHVASKEGGGRHVVCSLSSQ